MDLANHFHLTGNENVLDVGSGLFEEAVGNGWRADQIKFSGESEMPIFSGSNSPVLGRPSWTLTKRKRRSAEVTFIFDNVEGASYFKLRFS